MHPHLFIPLQLLLLLSTSSLCHAQLTARIEYDAATHRFSLRNPPPITSFPGASRTARWGIYYWEFGDGHFSFDEAPVHHYRTAGTYEISLHLTPFYALEKPFSPAPIRIPVQGGGPSVPRYDLQGRDVYIQTNTLEDLVPGHEMQFILHYANSTDRTARAAGHLLFFFNKRAELRIGYSPFHPPADRPVPYRLAYGENDAPTRTPVPFIENNISGSAQQQARELYSDYEEVLIFNAQNLSPAEQRRVFLSLQVDERLRSQQDKNRRLTVAAMWVPQGGAFDPKLHYDEYQLQVLAVHDPNRIRVKPSVAYFRKPYPKTLTYTVDFQNKAEGTAQDVVINLGMDRGLAVETVKLESLNPYMQECPLGQLPDTLSCYRLEPLNLPLTDTLRIRLHNIGLEGKKSLGFFQNKRSSKGQVVFTLQSTPERTPANRLRAGIIFNEVDPILTGRAVTHWRQRGLFVRPTYELALSGSGFEFSPEEEIDRLGISLSVLDVPVATGVIAGAELGYTPLSMLRQTEEIFTDQENFPDSARYITREQTRLQTLDLTLQGGYQLRGWVRGIAGLGVSLPLRGRTHLEGTVRDPVTDFVVFRSEDEARYGLLEESDPATLFNQSSELRQSVGGFWRMGVEIGPMSAFTVGIMQDVRYYPRFYHDHCAAFTHYTAFIRFRLAPLGGRR